MVSARNGLIGDRALPISNFRSPVVTVTNPNDRLKELLDIGCPVFDPFGFSADGKDSASSLSLERSNFVGPHAFGKPDGSGRRYIFAQAMVQEYLPSYAVRNCST